MTPDERRTINELVSRIKEKSVGAGVDIIQLVISDDEGSIVDISEGAADIDSDYSLLTKAGTARACLRDIVLRHWKNRNNIEINTYSNEER